MIRKKITSRKKTTSFKPLKLWFWTKNSQPFFCFTPWRQTSEVLQHLTSGCFSKLIILLRFREWHHRSNRMVCEYLQIVIPGEKKSSGYFCYTSWGFVGESISSCCCRFEIEMYLTQTKRQIWRLRIMVDISLRIYFSKKRVVSKLLPCQTSSRLPLTTCYLFFVYKGHSMKPTQKIRFFQGKPFKFIIHLHCLISTKMGGI